jgi:hypothetical protein
LKSKSPEKLKEIADVLCKSQDKCDNPGVLSGISGLELAGGSKYADIGEDISGMAWTREHLAQHRFIDGKDIPFLNDLEPYLLSGMERGFDWKISHGRKLSMQNKV